MGTPRSVPEGIILVDQLYLFDIYKLFINGSFFSKINDVQ
jgi:hypothetical protein